MTNVAIKEEQQFHPVFIQNKSIFTLSNKTFYSKKQTIYIWFIAVCLLIPLEIQST